MEIPRYARDDMLIRWLVEERSGDLRHQGSPWVERNLEKCDVIPGKE